MIWEQTTGWMCESIGCFGLTASQPPKTIFNLFSKHLRVKQSVVSRKQQVVFHLVWKTLSIQKVWKYFSFKIQSRVDLHNIIYLDPILKHLSNNKHIQPSIKLKGFGFFKAWIHLIQQSPPIWWRQIFGCLCWTCLNLKQNLHTKHKQCTVSYSSRLV